MKFLRNRVAVLEVVGDHRDHGAFIVHNTKSTSQQGHLKKKTNRLEKPRFLSHPTTLVATKSSNSSNSSCPCCSGVHSLGVCARFKTWAVDERSRWTREHKLCFNCFSADHWAPRCTVKSRCHECSRRHHSLLHPPGNATHGSGDAQQSDVVLCASAPPPQVSRAMSVLLGMALVHVRDRVGSWQTLRALIDCASQISVITTACADRLGLRRDRWTTPVTGLSGVTIMNVQGRVDCVIQP